MRTILLAVAVLALVSTSFAAVDGMSSDAGWQLLREPGFVYNGDEFGYVNGWQGPYNNRVHGRPELMGWGSGTAACQIARFSRTDLATNIAEADATYGAGGWVARMNIAAIEGANFGMSWRMVGGPFDVDDRFVWDSTAMATHRDGSSGGTVGWAPGNGNFENAVITSGTPFIVAPTRVTVSYNQVIPHNVSYIEVPQQWFRDYAAGQYDGFFFSNASLTTPQAVYPGNQWGGIAGPVLEILPVPEPATMGLLLVGGVAALIRRKR